MEEENKHIDELIANYLTEGLDKNALDAVSYTHLTLPTNSLV